MPGKDASLGMWLLSMVSCWVPNMFIFNDNKINAITCFQGSYPEPVPIILLLGNNQLWTLLVMESVS